MSEFDAGPSAPGTGFRIETDALGDVAVPTRAYWGAHTARALEDFRVSWVPVSVHPCRRVRPVRRSCRAR
ncbi:hypothetical protein [Streptomyces stelliscabiei]|uniref:Aspartate ammonia-lyase n=1 Tax=Streptomyces stelliscabiei TaxID=146820 RepID=A0A8I0NVU1_9ACTN|nr:hypothetical protein [Streptomyces stelliscabiei]KND41802.1 hypothetical protein IQ64_27090 [Streptomyces stelliscabiei]MBE1594508.1 aspartate ammonia-lyase [Streptomyces stelliscabiei]MDX2518836.1 hypothetical protein [Streptomyces stelliscabiei]